MAAALPTADDIIAVVQDLISTLGPDAFRTNGRIQLYSGPREIVHTALTYFDENHDRSFQDAARLLTTPIDYTKIGAKLEKYENDKNIYQFFYDHYAPHRAHGYAHADKVMRFASREFIRASYGYAATTVCGADLSKIFFEVELPEIVANHKITTINEIPAELVREFHAVDPYEAFRLICISELIEARHYARASALPEAWKDYHERHVFFTLEQKDSAKLTAHIPASVKAERKLRKRQILATYSLGKHGAAISGMTPAPATPVGGVAKMAVGSKATP